MEEIAEIVMSGVERLWEAKGLCEEGAWKRRLND